mmetsp:Transcript_121414/g.223565  ORF Transcript_121414/g.223565 Transcript_121414/m.223565 type:complete len:301 (+) Transcript_121414:83-985(+)
MAALAAVASQLRASQGSSSLSAGVAAAQAGSAIGSVSGAFQAARGAASTFVTEARTNLLPGRSGVGRTASAIPADGTRCEGCGEMFGILRRRQTCGSCDRFLCGPCLGGPAVLAPISCFCAATCPRCRDQNLQTGEFDRCREAMQSGVSVTMSLPKKAGLLGGSGGTRKEAVWFCVDVGAGDLHWATLAQKNGRPAEEGRIPVSEVLAVRNTGVAVELAIKGQAQPTNLDFGEERDTWSRYLEVAVEVLTPESERAALDAARDAHRHLEMEERRRTNEERKKKLSEGLGMRFTAEAMMRK